MTKISKNHIEILAIECLEDLGYQYIYGLILHLMVLHPGVKDMETCSLQQDCNRQCAK